MPIQPLEQALTESLIILGGYQEGKIKQIRTNRPWLDSGGGITPKNFITIFGASFSGKSSELESLKSDIMNTEINPDANEYVWVSNSLEMTNFATTIRDIKKITKRSYKEILSTKFTDEEKKILGKYREQKTDGRFFVNYVPLSAEDFIKETTEFLEQNKDKKLVVFDLDHAALLKAKNDNKKLAIDDMVEGLNTLKNKYSNFLVVLVTQANRSVLARLKEKSNESRLRRDDIYMSDTMYHVSDYVYGLQNANYLGIEQYAKIKPEKYEHLKHRFTEADKNDKVSLYTEGCIFVEVLKDRTADVGFTDLYTIELKDFEKPKQTNIPQFTSTTPVFSTPLPLPQFESTNTLPEDFKPISFGELQGDDSPF